MIIQMAEILDTMECLRAVSSHCSSLPPCSDDHCNIVWVVQLSLMFVVSLRDVISEPTLCLMFVVSLHDVISKSTA